MKSIRNIVYLIIIILLGCEKVKQNETITGEEYKIYSSIIDSVYINQNYIFVPPSYKNYNSKIDTTFLENNNPKIVILLENLIKPKYQISQVIKDNKHNDFEYLQKDADDEKKEITFDNLFELELPVVLINSQDLDKIQIRERIDWNKFYNMYPESKGYISFSEIIFNKDKSEAFVYYEKYSNVRSAIGEWLILQKNVSRWFIKKKITVWIS